MNQHITIISLGVQDLAKSTKFYQDVFGWEPAEHSNEDITFIQLENILLSLYPTAKLAEDAGVPISNTSGHASITLAHNVSSEKEVDEIIQSLESRGVQVIKRPQKVFWGGYSSYVTDLDGYLWEIAYNPFM